MEAENKATEQQTATMATEMNVVDPNGMESAKDDMSLLASVADPGKTEDGKEKAAEEDKSALETAIEAATLEALKLPKGQTLDEELGKTFMDIVNDGKLTRQELAQKLLDVHASTIEKFLAAQAALSKEAETKLDNDIIAENKEWLKACMNDSEFGGTKWDASQATIAKGRDYLFTKELTDYLIATNQGNHPEIIRLAYRAGKMFEEGRFVNAESKPSAVNVADAHWGAITSKYFKDEKK